jgi:transmembrane sensor
VQQELIQRFFLQQCTPAEAKQVADFLKENPSVLEKYLSAEEWNALSVHGNLPEEFWDEVWQNIRHLVKAKAFAVRMKRLAAAASIILVAGVAILYHVAKKPAEKTLEPSEQTQTIVTPAAAHKTIANTTSRLMLVHLQDGSVVELSPASTIQFDVPFPANKRDIVLEGEAKFHVSKNKQKPFTVYADAFATTALGTVFTVKKGKAKNTVTVKLYEGKVVVHSTDKNLNGWKDDVYLQPGRQMHFNAVLQTLAVNNISSIKSTGIVIQPKQLQDAANAQLVFDNTDLSKVMDQLAAYYKVRIQYDAPVIDTMNFTGAVSKNDSLPFILKIIGQMNNLEIITMEDGFRVIKPE